MTFLLMPPYGFVQKAMTSIGCIAMTLATLSPKIYISIQLNYYHKYVYVGTVIASGLQFSVI